MTGWRAKQKWEARAAVRSLMVGTGVAGMALVSDSGRCERDQSTKFGLWNWQPAGSSRGGVRAKAEVDVNDSLVSAVYRLFRR